MPQKAIIICKGLFQYTMSRSPTLQRKNTEISKQIFPEKEYRGLSPNFHIHASVSDLNIPTIGLPILLEEICRPILGLCNRSQTHECWNWGWGRAIPRKGKYKEDFRCSATGSKGTLWPDFQANTWSKVFLKANVTTRYRKEVVRKARYR